MALYHLPNYQTSFESTGLSVQEKKFNINFQDGSHPCFTIKTILAIFLSTCHLDTSNELSFVSIGLSVRKKKIERGFQNGGHSGHTGFSIGMILSSFDLHVALILPSKLHVSWPISSREKSLA